MTDTTPEPYAALSEPQRARVDALNAARVALAARSAFTAAPPPDALDLVQVARWILDGRDPWATGEPE